MLNLTQKGKGLPEKLIKRMENFRCDPKKIKVENVVTGINSAHVKIELTVSDMKRILDDTKFRMDMVRHHVGEISEAKAMSTMFTRIEKGPTTTEFKEYDLILVNDVWKVKKAKEQ